MIEFSVGIDLARKSDYTAVAIARVDRAYLEGAAKLEELNARITQAYDKPKHYDAVDIRFLEERGEELEEALPEPRLEIVQAYRLPQGTDYVEVKEHLKKIMASPTLRGRAELVIDATGVGWPIVDDVRQSGLRFRAVTLASPTVKEHRDEDDFDHWIVPKTNVVSRAKVLLDSGRLRIASGLRFASTLVNELVNFRYATTLHGNPVYGAWREGQHDDLVLALALAVWGAERGNPGVDETLYSNPGPFEVKEKDLYGLDEWFMQAPERGDELIDREPRPWHLDLR